MVDVSIGWRCYQSGDVSGTADSLEAASSVPEPQPDHSPVCSTDLKLFGHSVEPQRDGLFGESEFPVHTCARITLQ